MKTYLYPQNLKARANLWLWSLRDFVILCAAVLVIVYLSDRSFKDADAMQKYFGMMPLAVVPSVQLNNKPKHSMRAAKEDD